MGKGQKKTGKGRLDKYYKLAKEQGYRARSAFKLIQLNKKYAFLESARCCIDLCAAPGGWLQVASKYMPANSVIVGVDLVPIKAIPRVVTFASDITTPACRTLIRNELKDWKADVVLHDGAPNVGTAWVQDAYAQSELVLMSLKLAVEFMAPNGTFVTKVFRSADYNNLVWVFNQLFKKVEATKPPSSRNVSAEIFVVCRGFLAPKFIDPKFLDPRHVFKDLAASTSALTGENDHHAPNATANVFQPEKKRRQRDGYADADYTLFHKLSAADFVRKADPVNMLGGANQITFETEEEKVWLKMDLTSGDVKANCKDLKVLGKGDFKALIRWRIALREELGLEVKTKYADEVTTDVVEGTEDVDEEEAIEQELERINAETSARIKRERRRANEIKTRTIQRMQLKMTAPMDIGLEVTDHALGRGQDEDVFDLADGGRIRGTVDMPQHSFEEEIDEAQDDSLAGPDREAMDSDEEREQKVADLESALDGMYGEYKERLNARDAKRKVREERAKSGKFETWKGIMKSGSVGDQSDADSEVTGEGGWEEMEEMKARLGEDSSSEDEDSDVNDNIRPAKKAKLITTLTEPKAITSQAAQVWFSQDVFSGVAINLADEDDEDNEVHEMDVDDIDERTAVEDNQSTYNSEDFETVPQEPEDATEMWDVAQEDQDASKRRQIKKFGLNTAEAITIAQQLVNRERTKTQLINDGFNRFSLNSKEGLPDWFLDDEAKNYKPNIPITKEAMQALRARQRALDARPIKKVAEAKARKKYKAAQRLDKAMKKAEGVNTTSDMSEKEKASAIEKLMRRGAAKAKKPKSEIHVVVAKGTHKGIKGRPKGVKGRYAMVDSRMKKELRAKKRTEKANKKRKRA